MRDRQDNGYRHLLDEVLRLVPRQHASPWVIQQAAALAAQVTVRRAADFLAGYLGTNVDHRTLHSLLRQPEIRDGAEAQRSFGPAQLTRCRQKSGRQAAGTHLRPIKRRHG